ncbi:ribosomal protein L3 glutamine methyltransferase [Thiogranum longum]|uniref:Ribosomal protein uL3 glutamine methyltransferase n=1 Tax=Thiogranum longum TaxID=1537524 RepID=A0A4R1HA35_9GAMM|nr:50S ribosomal protein L3 N(5)-glutamine methyltransferase [Thiogranum longum]TCK18787.1 ribosomal protein L3 glutamine methyltransferase [Thiogranum longum]
MADQAELQTIRDLVRWGASRFRENGLVFGHGTDNAFDEALVLVSHALHLPVGFPEHYLGANVTTAERSVVLDLLGQRIETRRPAAYLTGEAWFAGLPFYVDERVLVPRSPMAEWIERGFTPWLEPDNVERVLDLCTGSGCIAVACAVHFDNAEVDAVDISPEALAVAKRNVERHGLEDWVRLVESDLFDALEPARYQLIISNPPYVPDEEMQALPEEYHHEPELGLRAEQAGLAIVVRILAQAADWLADDGILVVEVGNSQDMLMECFPDVPFTWLDFERGGHGVFLLDAGQTREFQGVFRSILCS